MWRLRLLRALLFLWPIFWSYTFQRSLARLLPRSAWVERRWQRLHEKNARRLHRACTRLGGVYIKLGQVLSVMGTFLPAVYARRLETLQDAVPPRPWRQIRRALKRGLGQPPEQLFHWISEEPIAAGSLAQVHEAELHNGQRVAVKVLYPEVSAMIKLDLKVLGRAVAFLQRRMPITRLHRVLEQLEDMLARESDLTHEAHCIAHMRKALHDDPDVIIPEVIHHLSSKKILTMTYMHGVKINDAAGLDAAGLDPQKVATKLVQVLFRTVFRERYFHADPHPGNLFVQRGDNGRIRLVLLDLGSATPLRDNLANGLWNVLEGLLREDEQRFLGGLERMGFMSGTGDRALLVRTLRAYFGRILTLDIRDFARVADSEVSKLDLNLSAEQARTLMQSIEYPLGWYELERAIVIVFGLVSTMAPSLNLVQVGMPYVMPMLLQRRAAEAREAASSEAAA